MGRGESSLRQDKSIGKMQAKALPFLPVRRFVFIHVLKR